MEKEQTEVCPFCRGDAVHSRDWVILDFPHFLKPWGSALRMDEKMVPWWCTNCGNITFRLKETKKVLAEYKTRWDKGKVVKQKKGMSPVAAETTW